MIEPEDRMWVYFLFYADGCQREGNYAWNKEHYGTWFLLRTYLYVILYPILFIWILIRKLK